MAGLETWGLISVYAPRDFSLEVSGIGLVVHTAKGEFEPYTFHQEPHASVAGNAMTLLMQAVKGVTSSTGFSPGLGKTEVYLPTK
jgi:hypothetical protein